MQIEILQNPDKETINYFTNKIDEYNHARWDIKEKIPLAIQVKNEKGERIAGGTGKTFGHWFLLDILWVSDTLRGQNMGSKLLTALEQEAKNRGCKFVLLDTLDFQARPFYEKHGYLVKWTQEQYPTQGSKYFMVKEL